MGRIVLVTGVSLDLGRRVAMRVVDDPGVSRVIGVDILPPRGDLGDVRFVRADIRNPVIAKVIAGEDVDTVIHTSVVASAVEVGGRMSMKEHNVIGTMQLLAACQRAPSLERLVVKSSAEVYGSSSRDPAMFSEDMAARHVPRSGYAKDVLEIEGYVRGFSRRRPDVTVTTVRNATTLGPDVRSPLAAYLRMPAIPKPSGFDARIMLLHHADLVAVLHHAAMTGVHGTFNVAGEGLLLLSQAIRKLGRPVVSVPGFALGTVASLIRQSKLGLPDFSPEQVRFITFGRGLDTSRMRDELGFEPALTTEQTLLDFGASLPEGPLAGRHPVQAAERLVAAARSQPAAPHVVQAVGAVDGPVGRGTGEG
jgi:UDP-glucose 4-epimerase